MRLEKKAVSGIMLTLLLICMFTSAFNIQPAKAESRIWTVDDDLQERPDADFTKIQDAVNVATAGDTIFVYPGTFIENVNVNKSLTIKSENGAKTTIVQAAKADADVFKVTANYAKISGFTVKGATMNWDQAGIHLRNVKYCNVHNNIASNNSCGIYVFASSNNNITNNNINSNYVSGIYIRDYSSNNKIEKNRVSNNGRGLWLSYSPNNTLANNTMLSNTWNFGLHGGAVFDFVQDIDISNLVNGKPIRYLINKKDMVIDSNWDIGYLGIVNSTNMTVKDLTLTDNINGVLFAHVKNSILKNVTLLRNGDGIYLSGSSHNTLSYNLVSNNFDGIWLDWDSCNNKIENNDVDSNNRLGIGISRYSTNNKIYLNNFKDNNDNAYSDSSTNIWNSTSKITYTYNGITLTNYLGNYWSDYTGTDADGDGIGDVPYSIDSDKDNYPLMEPFENYQIGPDFSITASPTLLTIQQGNSDTLVITVMSTNGFNQPVQLTVSGAPVLKWTFEAAPTISGTLAVGSDGTIYYGSYNNKLYAINPNGVFKWIYDVGDIITSSCTVGPDGTIYFLSYYNDELRAINPDGALKWSYNTSWTFTGWCSSQRPAIGLDGTIYCGYYGICALYPNGTLRWEIKWFQGGRQAFTSFPAIGPDGTIYINVHGCNLSAINPDGTLKWHYFTGGNVIGGYLPCQPAISPDGTIYFASYDGKLSALNPNGTLKWSYELGVTPHSNPVVASNGDVYLGSWEGKLYALSSNGTLKWSFNIANRITSPAIAEDGTLYCGSGSGELYALSPNGKLEWSFKAGGGISSPPVVGPDSTIYFGCGDGKLYAVGSLEVTSTLNPEQVTPPPDGSITSTLTISVAPTAPPGSYTLTVTGTSGTLTHSTYVSLEITVAPPTYVQGIDVRDDINWVQVYNAGYRFAFVKATEGIDWKKPGFEKRVDDARKAGLFVGVYHFARPVPNKDKAKEEAESFVRLAADYLQEGYLRPALDVEDSDYYGEYPEQLGKETLAQWIETWMDTVKSMTGVEPILYMNGYIFQFLSDSSIVDQYDIWIPDLRDAEPSYDDSPNTRGWNTWAFWQYKQDVTLAGGTADLDVFNGDISKLQTFVIPENQPPVPDAGQDQLVSSGDLVVFNSSDSYDPDGTIVSYRWDFGDDMTGEGKIVNHRFRGAQNEPKTYTVTLTVEDNYGVKATDTAFVTVKPLRKLVDTGPGYFGVSCWMEATYNWVGTDEATGENLYIISKIETYSGGISGAYQLFILRRTNPPPSIPKLVWYIPLPTAPILRTYVTPFTPSVWQKLWGEPAEITALTFQEGTFQGIGVTDTSLMLIVATGTETGITLYYDAGLTKFEPGSPIVRLKPEELKELWELRDIIDLLNKIIGIIGSPCELRIYDSKGHVTGLVNGEIREEIPGSAYANGTILILSPNETYRYELVGMKDGTYELLIISVEDVNATTFTTTEIPTLSNAIHQYTIDWSALSRGEEGVTIQIDSNGDGTFEKTFTAGSELTRDEFMQHVFSTEAFPMWIAGVAVAAIAIVTIAIAVFWRKRKRPPTKG